MIRHGSFICAHVVCPVLPLLAISFLLPLPVAADDFSLSTMVQCDNGPQVPGISIPPGMATTSSAFCSTSTGTIVGTASALATFGALRGDADVSFNDHVSHFNTKSEYMDTLTLGGFVGDGFVQYEYVVDLEVASNAPGVVRLNTESRFVPCACLPPANSHLKQVFLSQLYPISAGKPFTLDFQLEAHFQGDFEAGYSHYNAYLDGLFVYDDHLGRIVDYQLTTASGHSPIVPEPASVWLLIGVAVWLVLSASRLSKRSRG